MKQMRLALALWVLLGLAVPLAADSLNDAVSQLIGRLGVAPRGPLIFQNLSSLSAADAGEVRVRIERAFSKSTATPGQPEFRITLSENIRGFLLIGQIDDRVATVPVTLPLPATVSRRVTLKRAVIREQAIPVLDFALFDSGTGLVVLEPARVALYRREDGTWKPSHAAVLNLSRPLPRDPRGKIESMAPEFRASLPGTTCIGSLLPIPRISCTADEKWAAGRNYFEGPRGAYFTAAALDNKILMAHLDRRARLWGEGSEPLAVIDGWGSDLARIDSGCTGGSIVLASGADDSQESVQAFEILNDQAAAISEPLAIPGPVTALWPSENAGEATAVVRNRKTGVYEASRVAIGCTP